MDPRHFDTLTRLFAVSGSRRAALTAVVGAVLFGRVEQTVGAATGLDAEHRRRRRRRKKNRRRCKGVGQYPKPRRRCCPGLTVDASGRCARGGCGSCPPCQRCSGGACVPNLAHNGRCCPGGICADGVCTACPAGQRCARNQCRCDGQSCPGGCCTAAGAPAGTCQPGTDHEVCGRNGKVCVTCANPTPYCVNQVCSACSPSVCPVGCCDAATGTCLVGTDVAACGANGAPCDSCVGGACAITMGGGACTP